MTKLLFLSGSARKDSVNKKLVKSAQNIAETLGVEVTYIDLSDFEMPIYNGDLEDSDGVPENAKKLKKIFHDHDGFFIASPEYNGSFSALLKNTIDWISRPIKGDDSQLSPPQLNPFSGKVAAISSASPGGLGGMCGLVPLRMLLGNIGVVVVPSQLAVSSAFKAFNDDNSLKDEKQQQMLTGVVSQLLEHCE